MIYQCTWLAIVWQGNLYKYNRILFRAQFRLISLCEAAEFKEGFSHGDLWNAGSLIDVCWHLQKNGEMEEQSMWERIPAEEIFLGLKCSACSAVLMWCMLLLYVREFQWNFPQAWQRIFVWKTYSFSSSVTIFPCHCHTEPTLWI